MALKVISARYSNQSEARARFRREARAAAQLRHPNVASVFHFGETPAGECFYVMELVEGETLEARVRHAGSLGPDLVLDLARQLAHALVAAEKLGLVHRDLKPSNLMLLPNDNNPDPLVKVIDFGLARMADDQGGVTTGQSGFDGTPGFASPEQCAPGTHKLDTRSDIYSLGATLFYALCGQPPSAGADFTALPVTELRRRKVPEALLALLRRMLAPEPAARPQSAKELSLAVEKCRRRLRLVRQRRRWLIGAALALGALLLVLGLTKRYLPGPEVALEDKSVAVLPFQNLNAEKENALFAGGVQDEILSDLAKVADLKVISRTSVMKYESAGPRNLPEIGRALGVSYAVEGSVERAGDRIRVTVQLIDARSDRHLWADHYDRKLTDIFAVQSEIAQEIADQLQSKLSPGEKNAITEQPTADLKA